MTLKIRYQRSGGFTGLVRGGSVDVAALGPGAAKLVARLVNAAIAAGVKPGKPAKSRGAADMRVHDLVIELDHHTLRWSFDEFSLPEVLRPLVAFMARRSKPMPPSTGSNRLPE